MRVPKYRCDRPPPCARPATLTDSLADSRGSRGALLARTWTPARTSSVGSFSCARPLQPLLALSRSRRWCNLGSSAQPGIFRRRQGARSCGPSRFLVAREALRSADGAGDFLGERSLWVAAHKAAILRPRQVDPRRDVDVHHAVASTWSRRPDEDSPPPGRPDENGRRCRAGPTTHVKSRHQSCP